MLGGLAALMAAAAPAVGLTPAEDALMERVPSAIRPFCVPDAEPPSSPAVAALSCDLPTSVGVIAEYSSYGSHQDLLAAYLRASVLMTGIAHVDYGNCSDGVPPGERIRFDSSGLPQGRWACYVRGGEAGLIWTRAGIPVLVWARRPDGRFGPLLPWHPGAGPLGETVTTGGGVVVQGPVALDHQLLREISPAVAAMNCVRVARPENARWTNALRCDRPGGGDVTYRRYPDSETAQADYARSLRGLRLRLRLGGACTGKPTERGYAIGGTVRGRFACTRDARGRARLDWWTTAGASAGSCACRASP
jgi:hypothetical protein